MMAPSKRMIGVAALSTLLGAGLLFLVGYGTAYWASDASTNIHRGLWKYCIPQACIDYGTNTTDWLKSIQALETLALLGLVAGAVLLSLSIFLSETAFHKTIHILAIVAIFGAAVCCIVGLIVFGPEANIKLDYSFYLTLVGGIGMGVAGILSIIHMRQ